MQRSLPHDAYDELAESYAKLIDTKPHNAYYERPAMQSLIGDVSGLNILDAGCGPGVYAEWLLNLGAQVTCVDDNEKMLEYAKRRNGDRAAYHQANLERPLSFLENDSFDGILCALAVSYIQDHSALFGEFGRMLKKGGWLTFSTEHPFFAYRYFNVDNYFETKQVSCEWDGFAKKVRMPSFYHSLGTIADSLTTNGFAIERILEPKPTEKFLEADPKSYEKLMKFPLFICIKARKK